MKCPACSAETTGGAIICASCGRALSAVEGAAPESIVDSNPKPHRNYEFRNPESLMRVLKVAVCLAITINVVGIGVALRPHAIIDFIFRLKHPVLFAHPELKLTYYVDFDPIERLEFATQSVQAVIYLVASILFLIWVYRASRNSWALGAPSLAFSPAWSVGWYFVPIANLWKPFQVMREIWKVSLNPGNWHAAPSTPLLGWWWSLFLITCLFSHWMPKRGEYSKGLAEPGAAGIGMAVSDALDLAFCVVAILLIGRISANQTARGRQMVVDVF